MIIEILSNPKDALNSYFRYLCTPNTEKHQYTKRLPLWNTISGRPKRNGKKDG
jgi:hypothetical protein